MPLFRVSFGFLPFLFTVSGVSKKRTFRKFSFRGFELEQLLDLPHNELVNLYNSRHRRRFRQRGIKKDHLNLLKKIRAKKAAAVDDRPAPVKTHLRNAIIVPEMVGSIIGIYNGKQFNGIQVMPEMLGHYLGEFSITYKPTRHGRPGIGAAQAARFIPL